MISIGSESSIRFYVGTVRTYIRVSCNREDRGDTVLRHSVPHFPLNFSRHCVTKRQAFAWVPGREMKILRNNNSFPRVWIEPTTVALQSQPCAPAPRLLLFYFCALNKSCLKVFLELICCLKKIVFNRKILFYIYLGKS